MTPRTALRAASHGCRGATLGVVLAAAALTGCVGKQETRTRFYLLSPLPAATAALPATRNASRGRAIALDIAALRLPQYLQRPQIVTRTSDNQVTLAEYDQWGGNLAKDMMRVLAQNLSRLLATPEITVFSRRPAGTTDLRVEIDVLQFERDADGRVRLAVQWRLRQGGKGAPVATRITELAAPSRGTSSDTTPGMEATVSAMSALWGEFSRIVAQAILDTLDTPGGAARS